MVLPDVVKENFARTDPERRKYGSRQPLLEWHWDADPDDDTFQVEMSFLLKDATGHVRAVRMNATTWGCSALRPTSRRSASRLRDGGGPHLGRTPASRGLLGRLRD